MKGIFNILALLGLRTDKEELDYITLFTSLKNMRHQKVLLSIYNYN